MPRWHPELTLSYRLGKSSAVRHFVFDAEFTLPIHFSSKIVLKAMGLADSPGPESCLRFQN